ncbi:MAG TPA: hypothetical protein VEJ67_16785 [Candidatus Cybelea sp.]|nr:hypothetical protein [Candidatus Cybelea sp.]
MNRLNAVGLTLALFASVFSASPAAAQDQNEVIVPAGTLLRCTLDEPNFSPKTAEVGDPVLCHLNQLLLFDHAVFPRGAYLGGHLEEDKQPGHFVGKGYLKLEFDRIGLPDAEIPVPAKIISAKGYKVDRSGKIIGHGHAVRDAVEWMIPPLWPEKVLTLPARGPQPTLKGEEQLMLRLMDDVAVPAESFSALGGFGRRSSEYVPNRNYRVPSNYVPHEPSNPASGATRTGVEVVAAREVHPRAEVPRSGEDRVLVLRSGDAYLTTRLHMDGNRLAYELEDGTVRETELDQVDWDRTFQANANNGSSLLLTAGSEVN